MNVFPLSNSKMFDKLLDKATSPLLIATDWQSILQLCDMIKTQEVSPKHVIQVMKKKFRHENAHIVLKSLQCLESIVKNCGGLVHKEIAQKDVMELFQELIKKSPDQIRNKVLEMIQCWSYGLGEQYKIIADTYDLLKRDNYSFPPLKESEAMFENKNIAPEWHDSKECFRCRQIFTPFIRKHHCRSCGNAFCDKCSSKSCPIPKFDINYDVRVCELCYEKLTNGISQISKPISSSKATSTITSNQTKSQVKMNDEDEESFQRALDISRREAEEKENQKKILTQKYALATNQNEYTKLNQTIDQTTHEEKENIQNEVKETTLQTNNFINEQEIDEFTTVVMDHIKNFKFRMLSNQQRNRNITTDTVVQSIFVMLQQAYPHLLHTIQLIDHTRTYYENLQDKLTQLKDAREALNALRMEHNERKQQETLERERQRQIQLAQKLDFMKQKKQEYLEYQRQVHLQQLAQQEFEMRTYSDQQRQLILTQEQCLQNSHLSSMMSHDYNQMHYQQPFSTLHSQSTTNQYPMITNYPTQPPHHGSMITCPSNTPNLMNSNRDNNYINLARHIPLTHSTVSYIQQQSAPMINENKSDPQLIIFN
ncbi:unnamed protein product [Adineta steineri]|uniref:Hepatocyte growth factor-regulated tyrosine kinase substrate n=1 Tax=Adineta steineri TaxID=433720 RepID=A0A818QFH0_9BILA|nr:unnamed protein product [Adineta steineri]